MKATLRDGTVLEGTAEELTRAIRHLGGQITSVHGVRPAPAGQSQLQASTVWTEENVFALWNCLYGKQKEFVRYLVERNGAATIQEVKKHLGLNQGLRVAGLRSCITRNARRETGYKKAEVVVWEEDGKGNWHYRIVPEVFVVLKRVI